MTSTFKPQIVTRTLALACVALGLLVTPYSQVHAQMSESQINDLEYQATTNDKLAFQLGYSFVQGTAELPQDLERGKALLQRLADGYVDSQYEAQAAYVLASLYTGSKGHAEDAQMALKYFKAASQYDQLENMADAPYRVAMATDDDKEYREYLEKSGYAGFVPAMLELYVAHLQGERIAKNDKAAVAWLKKAAKAGHAEAQAQLGALYFDGEMVYQDYDSAYYWIVRAAEQNHAGAQAKLGLMYKLGLGRPVSKEKAMQWFERSHAQSHLLGTENLASLLLDSTDQAEQQRGVELMQGVAEAGVKSAAAQMVRIYELGIGVEKNPSEAERWLARQEAIEEQDDANFIGVNTAARSAKVTYQVSMQTMEQYELGIEAARQEDWDAAQTHLLAAARGHYPAAQLDLARVYIAMAEQQEANHLYETAYAWAKIARDSQQSGAQELVEQMMDVFPTDMLERGLRQYNLLKEDIE